MAPSPQSLKQAFGRKDRTNPIGSASTSALNDDAVTLPRPSDPFRFGPIYYEIRSSVLSTFFAELGEEQLDRLERSQLTERLAKHVAAALRLLQLKISRVHAERVTDDLVDDLVGFGPLEELLRQPEITDIMVIGPELVFFEQGGQMFEAQIRFFDAAHLLSICQRIARRIGRRIDESSPMCDARLPDGSRVNIVVAPLAIDGTALTIRKFQKQRLNFSGLLKLGALDERCIALLRLLVEIRCNIIVVGGTGSGKTTFLNCLNQSLASRERIVTCEDAAELQLQQRHIVRLETRSDNLEGTGEIDMRALVRNSLRMRPDRIIVGEIRGEEAFDFIQAMNTGHDGSMGTMHANSCLDALSRLEGLISLGAPSLPIGTIQKMITSALDVIIEVRRFRDGTRRLSAILEVIGFDESGIITHPILEFRYSSSVADDGDHGTYQFDVVKSPRIRTKADHRASLTRLDSVLQDI